MGVGTILTARKIIIIALGEHKAPIVRRALEEPQIRGGDRQLFADASQRDVRASTRRRQSELTAIRTPWLVGPVRWNPAMEKRAVIWLSQQDQEAAAQARGPRFRLESPARFASRMRADRGHSAAGVRRPARRNLHATRAATERQKIIVFSPHPDDDVISMGGTLGDARRPGARRPHRLHDERQHRRLRPRRAAAHRLRQRIPQAVRACIPSRPTISAARTCETPSSRKQPADFDTDEVLNVKTLIRKTEATAAAKTVGVPEEKLHFLDLPFYRTGKVSKRPIGDEDVAIIAKLAAGDCSRSQIYVAGDLSDPHGTHRVCAQAILRALEAVMRGEGIAARKFGCTAAPGRNTSRTRSSGPSR